MTSSEIQEEAKRRLEQMSDTEKEAVWGFSDEDNAFLRHVAEIGQSKLSEEESRRFMKLFVAHAAKCLPGGMIENGIVKDVNERYQISQDDLIKGAKNPYGREIKLLCVIGLAVAVIGAVIAVVGSRHNMEWMKIAGISMEAGIGVLALRFSGVVMAFFRYRKVQKKYMSGSMDEELLRAEICSQLFEERKKFWYR